MRIFIRIVGLATLAAFFVLRIWIGMLGLVQLIGVGWAVALAAGLLLAGFLLPLRLAVVYGAVTVWHWPLLLAVILAAPRLILVLPGLISTFLASRRHPRPRWSAFKAA
jgi:MFS family permease